MAPAVWQLEGHVARLRLVHLGATVDLSRPADGLTRVSLARRQVPAARLLALTVAWAPSGGAEAPVGCCMRRGDLMATYERTEAADVRVDAMWRAIEPRPGDGFLAGLELIVSVRSESLRAHLQLEARSKLPASEVLRPAAADPADWRPICVPPGGSLAIDAAEGPGGVLFRLAGVDLSYAEMVYPADFRRDTLTGSKEAEGTAELSHPLCCGPLEKGVMLRSRLQGALLPRADDVRLAAECYRAFAASHPVLST